VKAPGRRQRNGPGKILVAYDGSPEAQTALLHAAGIVAPGSRITVVNVIPVYGVSARLETISDTEDEEQRRVLAEAHALLDRKRVKADLVSAIGDPFAEILAAAEAAEAGTIIIGQARRRLPLRLSVGERLARRAKCDVLVVH
jgi:nucleotide-binding universal stress UspA family protein